MSETETGVSWLHRFGSLVAVMTFLLYMTGILASESGPGLFTPHWVGWGASGQPFADPPGKYVHVYQFFAIATIILTLTFVLWLWKNKSHRYLKILGSITVGVLLFIALMVLSPMRNLSPKTVSFWYTCGIQVFFCLTVCLALFTRTDWRWDEFKMPDLASPSIRQILVFMTVAVFVQMLLDEGFHKKEMGMGPHLVLGIAVTICSLWVLEMALTKFSHLRAFKISAVLLAEVVCLQLFLGIISYSMDLNARAVPGSQPGLVVMTVTTAAVGALVLATSLFVTCQGFKYFVPAGSRGPSAVLNGH
jgi:hypothetical protein